MLGFESTTKLREQLSAANLRARPVRVFGVDYLQLVNLPEGDLYLTRFGVPWLEHLLPANWNDAQYYSRPENAQCKQRLPGSGNPYQITTQPVAGRSLQIVVKWCRVGQEMLLYQTQRAVFISDEDFLRAAWNSPFEEFEMLLDLRAQNQPGRPRLLTQRPLAIYSPAEKYPLWQTGRSEQRMDRHSRRLFEDQSGRSDEDAIELDIRRLYALIYGWVEGIDAAQAFKELQGDPDELEQLTKWVYHHELRRRGYVVLDTKPEHFIVRRRDGRLLRNRRGELAFALIDFELLQRTPEYEKQFRFEQRRRYWRIQLHRDEREAVLPEALRSVKILGVDYIYGTAYSKGKLWVIGNNAELFDYFDPARWRQTPRIRLSMSSFRTKSLDNIQLVYRFSRVGIKPQLDPSTARNRRILDHGYNSPFEEARISEDLRQLGIPVVYLRAIYKTAHESTPAEWLADDSRFLSHRQLLTPEGEPVLEPGHDYFNLWGYWRGIDPLKQLNEKGHWGLVDLEQAQASGLLSQELFEQTLHSTRERLRAKGFQEMIRSDRLLLSFNQGELERDPAGRLKITICISAWRACQNNLLSLEEHERLLKSMQSRLHEHGYESLNLTGDHLLLSIDPDGLLQRDAQGRFEAILCNFELLHAPWMDR